MQDNNEESSQSANINPENGKNDNQDDNSGQSNKESDTPETQEESTQENDPAPQKENSDDDTSNNNSTSENEENPTQFTVWVNPKANGSQSTLSSEAIKSISNNGTLAVSIDSSIPDVEKLQLSSNQVGKIIERNINLLITKGDMEWVIPSTNFNSGETTLKFPLGKLVIPNAEQALSPIHTFSMVQNGAEIVEFEEPMIFRFISEENWNTDEQSIYVWSNGEWREYLSQFSKKGAQTSINHTGTLAVFNHSTFQESEEREKTPI